MSKITLKDVRFSRVPQVIGLCQEDIPGIAAAANEAQQRLIFDGGDSGFWGGWEKVLFTPSRTSPYITLGREHARAINLDVCRHPIRLWNQFYTVLPGGPGLPPSSTDCQDWCGTLEGYDNGNVPTMVDLPTTSIIRVYASDPVDVANASRIMFKGQDQNGADIYSQDGYSNVQGFYLTLDTPFVDSSFTVSKIQEVIKDETLGSVIVKAVNPTTLVETTLATYAPRETHPSYRRYHITALPTGCCPLSSVGSVQVTALCKREFIPVALDTDFLIIGNIPALIEECMSIRLSEMDDPKSMAKAEYHHRRALQQLNNELRHYLGDVTPSIAVDLWEGSPLQAQKIGSML